NTAPGIVQLCHIGPGAGAPWRPAQLKAQLVKYWVSRAFATVFGCQPIETLAVAALFDPVTTQLRQTAPDIDIDFRVRVRPRSVINGQWRISPHAVVADSRRQFDFAHRHANVRA